MMEFQFSVVSPDVAKTTSNFFRSVSASSSFEKKEFFFEKKQNEESTDLHQPTNDNGHIFCWQEALLSSPRELLTGSVQIDFSVSALQTGSPRRSSDVTSVRCTTAIRQQPIIFCHSESSSEDIVARFCDREDAATTIPRFDPMGQCWPVSKDVNAGATPFHSTIQLCQSSIASQVDFCDRSADTTAAVVVKAMLPDVLADLLVNRPSSPLTLLDCRTFVSYNANHVNGALNVACVDCISRKRLMCGKTTIAEIVSGCSDAKERYRRSVDDGAELVVYDDDTTDVVLLPLTHPLQVIFSCLRKEGRPFSYLQGGLQAFYKKFNHLCSQPTLPPSRPFLYSPTTPMVESEVDLALVSQILPHLYLGNERDAINRELLVELGITHILNVTSHVPFHFETTDCLTYKRLPASDSANQNLRQYFDEAIQFIDEAENEGGHVLIHCQAGVSRSSTIAIAYVMHHSLKSMIDSFHFVKSKRSIVAPNFNFMGQLLDFESTLNRDRSKSPDED